MKLEYKILEQDFLNFQLFAASKSNRVRRNKISGWISLFVACVLVTVYFYVTHNHLAVICFGFVAVIIGLFYPKYFKWRYKRHYKKYIRENYTKRFGQTESMEILEDSIFTKNKTGEGKINISELEEVNETKDHFFIKVSTGVSFILPKRELGNIGELKEKFRDIELIVNDETDWNW